MPHSKTKFNKNRIFFLKHCKHSIIINLFRDFPQLSLSSHIIVSKQLALNDRHPGRIKTNDLLFTAYPKISATDFGNNLSLDRTKFWEYYIVGLRAKGLKFCFSSKISKVRDHSVLIMCVLITLRNLEFKCINWPSEGLKELYTPKWGNRLQVLCRHRNNMPIAETEQT